MDTSETSIRIWVFSAVIVGWFVSISVDTFNYIILHGHPLGGEELFNWVSVFTSNYLIFIIMIICYLLAEWNIERKFSFSSLPTEYSNVRNIVVDLSQISGLKSPPKIRFVDTPEPYSFTYGKRSKRAKLILSKGLIEVLEEEELKSVILHELAHIKNKDLAFMTWGLTLINALKYWLLIYLLTIPVGVIKYYLEGKLWEYIGFYIHVTIPGAIAMVTIFIVLPFLVINSTSRIREFLADAYACKFIEEKHLKSSFTKIYKVLILSKLRRSLAPSHLSILSVSPPSIFPNVILQHTIATHPSIKDRVEAIEEKKYVKSWESACRIDRKVVYNGIIAFIITWIGLEMQNVSELLMGSEPASDYSFLWMLVIPLLFIFWINGRHFMWSIDHFSFLRLRQKTLGLLRVLVRNLVSTATLSITWVILMGDISNSFGIFFLFFLAFSIFAFLYTAGIGGSILFDYAWSRIRGK